MKKNNFDCVEFMHRAGRKIDRETKDMTFQEEVEYWKQKSDSALKRHAERQKAAKKGRPA